MAAVENAAEQAPSANEYIAHHLTFLKNKEPSGIIDMTALLIMSGQYRIW